MGCSVNGCDATYYSKGYCRVHYVRWKRHGDPLAKYKPGRQRQFCTIEECNSPQAGQGLCDKHYRRQQRHGSPLDTKRIIGDTEARWWSHVDRRGDDECWPWKATISTEGIAHFGVGQKVVNAARWGYERFVGPISGRQVPDHTCHDPAVCKVPHRECPHRSCCNWRHMEQVTNRVNVLRGARTKLSDETVAILHGLWQAGTPAIEIAETAGVNKATLYKRFRQLEASR